MITPTKMSKLQNNEVVKMYEKLNQEITKSIINKIQQLGDISKYSKVQFQAIINEEKKKIYKDALKRARKLNTKSKIGINKVFNELRDGLNDNRQYNKEGNK